MTTPRWLVQLLGDAHDIEDFPRWFPDGPTHVVCEEGQYYMTGEAFEACGDVDAVRNLAESEADTYTAAAKLLIGRIQRPRLGAIYREDANGAKHAFVQGVTADLAERYKVRGTDGCDERPTRMQRLAHVSRMHEALAGAMMLWADEVRTWPRLYRILEEVERAYGGKADTVGLCSGEARKRFARSANLPQIAGKDARHAARDKVPPKKPMALEEANKFVGSVLLKALQCFHAHRPAEGSQVTPSK